MVKTLRITTIIAALVAAGFLVFSAIFGSRGDKAIAEFLESPTAIENFQQAKGDQTRSESQVSPLVKQAKAFALYLDPPPAPKPAKTAPSGPSKYMPSPRPKMTSAKFKLIGTSFYELHSDLSLALIDEPGKGLRWVRQAGQVGHLVIEQVKDGLVVVKDGERTFEIAVIERPKKVNLLKSSGIEKTDTKAVPQPAEQIELVSPLQPAAAAKIDAEKTAALEGLIREMRDAREVPQSDQTGTKHDKKDIAVLEKFIEAIRISAEEAKKLDNLGKKLQNGNAEPNIIKQPSSKIEHKPPPPRRRRGR